MASIPQDKVSDLKKQAILDLSNYLDELIEGDEDSIKRASLMSYWIKDYTRFLKKESHFSPKDLIKYERGDIINVNLGFRLKNEEGGLHFAVVLDADNAKSSGIITVVPLSSLKEKFKPSKYSIKMDSDIFKRTLAVAMARLENVSEKQHRIDQEIKLLKAAIDEHKLPLAAAKLELIKTKRQEVDEELARLQGIGSRLEKMKRGSIALLSQVTTISKIRIYDPINTASMLYGVKMSDEDVKAIDEGLNNLYQVRKTEYVLTSSPE